MWMSQLCKLGIKELCYFNVWCEDGDVCMIDMCLDSGVCQIINDVVNQECCFVELFEIYDCEGVLVGEQGWEIIFIG